MSNWKKYKLGEFAEINPRVPLKQGNEYSFVEMKDLDPTQKFVLPSARKELKGGSKFQNGDTLFARITPCLENGKICQVKGLENGIGFGSTEFLVFRGKEDISNSDFVYYLARTDYVRNNAIQMMTGTSGRQRVEKSALQELEIIAPDSIKIQTQIASILSSLDDKIELNLQMNQTLEAMAQAIFKEWFINFNFPGFDGELVDGLPKGWKVGKLREIALISKSTLSPSSTPDTTFKHYSIPAFDTGMVPMLDKGATILSNKFVVRSNSILVSKLNPRIPRVWFVLDVNEDISISSTEFLVVQPMHFNFYSFLFCFLTLPTTIDTLIGLASGTSGSHQRIKPNDILDLNLVIPDESTITQYNVSTMSFFEKKQINIDESQTLIQVRDTLLPQLITGKIEIEG